jgi:hypothetical protein
MSNTGGHADACEASTCALDYTESRCRLVLSDGASRAPLNPSATVACRTRHLDQVCGAQHRLEDDVV